MPASLRADAQGLSGTLQLSIRFTNVSAEIHKQSRRLDVSSLGLTGSLSCPADPVYASWPPPPPPLPKPCTEGPDPRRGCPHLQWYWANQTAVGAPVAAVPSMAAAVPPVAAVAPAAPAAAAPAGAARGSDDSAGVLYTNSIAGGPVRGLQPPQAPTLLRMHDACSFPGMRGCYVSAPTGPAGSLATA